jgi:hypothetical protein
MKLDRTRPFGQVFGSPEFAYEQDNKVFDHNGDEVRQASKPGPKPKKQETGELSQIDAQLQG